MIHVTIADDHPLVREGIKKILQDSIDIEIKAEASNANELMPLLREEQPDILILDITMPGKSGLDILKDINKRYPQLPVLILSIHPEERFAVRALKAGASGYLNKSSITEELVNAVRKIVGQERRYINPGVAEQLAQQLNYESGEAPHKLLSDREFQVLLKIASGKKVSAIAHELSLSPNTVHTYRSRIKEKMDLGSNVEITRYAMENNLVE